jgi:WD40 repeat protein
MGLATGLIIIWDFRYEIPQDTENLRLQVTPLSLRHSHSMPASSFHGKSLMHAKSMPDSTNSGPFFLMGHTSEVLTLTFSSSSASLVSGDQGGTILLWDTTTCEIRHKLGAATVVSISPTAVWSVDFSPCGTKIVSGSGNRFFNSGSNTGLTIYDVQTGKTIGQHIKSIFTYSSVRMRMHV